MILDHALLVGCGNCSSVIPDWNRGAIGRAAVIFSSSSRRPSLSISCYPTVVSMCKARSNKRNPDFARKYRGSSSKGKRQSQEREKNSENLEDNLFPSKNGPLASLSNNQRYSSTATPGRREKEIVELFRKVQSQLRERAAIKEEKRVEASAQRGSGERGTVDSLLKLLRKHSVAQGKKSANSDDVYDRDEPERANPFDGPETSDLFEEEQQQSNFFVSDNLGTTQNDVCEPPDSRPSSRPVSIFKRKSPVPKVKFQPVFSVEEEGSTFNSLKNVTDDSSELSTELGPQTWHIHEPEHDEPATKLGSLDVDGEMGVVVDPLEFSDLDETDAGMPETSSIAQGTDLSSMKVSELRGLAKSKGIRGYSKLKKSELLELLNLNTA